MSRNSPATGEVQGGSINKRRLPLMTQKGIAMLKMFFVMMAAGTLAAGISTAVFASPLSDVVVPQMSDAAAASTNSL